MVVAHVHRGIVLELQLSGQAVFYVARERQHFWSSRPGRWLLVSSTVDPTLISFLAINGVLMKPIPISVVVALFVAATLFAFLLDTVKVALFRRLKIA